MVEENSHFEEDIFDLFLTRKDLEELLKKMGYQIDNTGIIIDTETGRPVKGIKTEEINIKKDKDFAVVSGSHIFVKNIAEFSHLLSERNLIIFKEKKQ
ncbi:hypothetical protein DRJ16_03420 [Candidatus Woesearchaeota archaeon]|nr:MAG: hypothetical protein DRJ16_03420 [Candidatus Woesearchaeota archaeon]